MTARTNGRDAPTLFQRHLVECNERSDVGADHVDR